MGRHSSLYFIIWKVKKVNINNFMVGVIIGCAIIIVLIASGDFLNFQAVILGGLTSIVLGCFAILGILMGIAHLLSRRR